MAITRVRLDFADASDLNVEIDEERILRDGIEGGLFAIVLGANEYGRIYKSDT